MCRHRYDDELQRITHEHAAQLREADVRANASAEERVQDLQEEHGAARAAWAAELAQAQGRVARAEHDRGVLLQCAARQCGALLQSDRDSQGEPAAVPEGGAIEVRALTSLSRALTSLSVLNGWRWSETCTVDRICSVPLPHHNLRVSASVLSAANAQMYVRSPLHWRRWQRAWSCASRRHVGRCERPWQKQSVAPARRWRRHRSVSVNYKGRRQRPAPPSLQQVFTLFRFTPSVHALIFVFVCVVAVPHECHRKALACHTSATMPRATSLLPRRNSTCRLCLVPAGELKMQLDEACCDCATQRKRAALQQLQWNRDRGNMCVARSKCMFVVYNPRREWTRGHVLSFFVMRCHKRQGTSRGET